MSSNNTRGGIIAGAGVPHAPQFWSMPETEDAEQVARIRGSMQAIGAALMGHQPDVVFVVGNDHTENYFRACVPAFSVHAGANPSGTFAERTFSCEGAPDTALDLVEALQARGFDPAFTQYAVLSYAFGIPLEFCGIPEGTPVIPIFVNAYVPPQPAPERCFAFGQALDQACRELGIRAVIIASGGMSHFPGTDLYEHPDVVTDQAVLDALKSGRTRELVVFDIQDLDETGNLELLPWVVLGGAIGQRKPDAWAFEASWHHTYTVVGWTSVAQEPRSRRHHRVYPAVRPDQQRTSAALYALRYDIERAAERFATDPASIADDFDVEADLRQPFIELDQTALRNAGIHPFLAAGAERAVDRHRSVKVASA